MEIKKYVLFQGKNGIELRTLSFHEDIWAFVYKKKENYMLAIKDKRSTLGILLKTSDNILDLVEVGDLVETKQSIMDVVEAIKKDEEFIFYLSHDVVFDNNIIAIYKKQPNGDYKKYEVTKFYKGNRG